MVFLKYSLNHKLSLDLMSLNQDYTVRGTKDLESLGQQVLITIFLYYFNLKETTTTFTL